MSLEKCRIEVSTIRLKPGNADAATGKTAFIAQTHEFGRILTARTRCDYLPVSIETMAESADLHITARHREAN